MYKCKICNKEFSKIQGLSTHILHMYKKNNKEHMGLTVQNYYDYYVKTDYYEGQCLVCGKPTTFKTLGSGYNTYCSNLKCSIITTNTVEKRKQTNLEKYGVDNPAKCSEIQEKIKETNLERYGTEYGLSNKEVIQKRVNTYVSNFLDSLFNGNRLRNLVTPLFNKEEWNGCRDVEYNWKCNLCNNNFKAILKFDTNFDIPRCPICHPLTKNGVSKYETEIYNYINELGINNIELNNRTILEGKELDIYLPDYNLAIEFNGLYWHSELNGKDRNYHLNKTNIAKEKNIQLIHIFEDEWINKQDIIKSIITKKLNKSNIINITNYNIQ